MIIIVRIDTDNLDTFHARNEDNDLSIEYNDIPACELTLDEIVNDFLT